VLATMSIAFVVHAQRKPSGTKPPTPTPAPSPARGWQNHQAFELAKEGIEAHQKGDDVLCVARDQASLAIEEHPYVRLHLSACLASLGRVKEALASANVALGAGIHDDDAELRRSAQERVEKLLARVAHVQLVLPKDSEGIVVTINGAPLRQKLRDT